MCMSILMVWSSKGLLYGYLIHRLLDREDLGYSAISEVLWER